MKAYFLLQYKMTNRRLEEAGVHPVIGYVIGLIGFALISEYLFYKTEFAKYLVLLIALNFLLGLSEKNRTDFLLSTFGNKKTRRIRVIENLLISLPFVMVLIYHSSILESASLITLAIISATITIRKNSSITIPTPFYKKPFEFTTGFRKTFYLFPVAYSLTIIAIGVDNINLGIFAMLLVFLVAMGYYQKPENEYFVWTHSDTPRGFIFNKLKLAARNVFILNLPVLFPLVLFYHEEWALILLFFLLGLIFLWTIVLAKYSAYPGEMNLPEGILIAICIFFPPLTLALIPFFYSKSVTKLKLLLDD